ncbi:four helix bundle protein [Mariprofundus erugo]|uniref:Four helix bundle protein n=1 Tax=Mariprofundus erugo TaxID=2528639 RepID=A0A5R9GRX7_9PROT|nr:four helix bundle protein [Mariprofundus erugo]TLS66752.1 four helix bundle protein [Mariprofundus erugo]
MRRKHHDLQVWQLGMRLVKEVYSVTRTFPESERFGLCSQMQRASVSIPSNIAEGAGRNGEKEFLQFLSIARGSLCELETQLMISHELGYVREEKEVLDLINETYAKLNALMTSIRARGAK